MRFKAQYCEMEILLDPDEIISVSLCYVKLLNVVAFWQLSCKQIILVQPFTPNFWVNCPLNQKKLWIQSNIDFGCAKFGGDRTLYIDDSGESVMSC